MSASDFAHDKIDTQAPRMMAIPAAISEDVADEVFERTAFRDVVEEQVRAGRSIFGNRPPSPEAEAEFVAWRKEKGR